MFYEKYTYSHIPTNIFYPVNDPKSIQGNIDNLDLEDKRKISSRGFKDYTKSLEAIGLQSAGYHRLAVNKCG